MVIFVRMLAFCLRYGYAGDVPRITLPLEALWNALSGVSGSQVSTERLCRWNALRLLVAMASLLPWYSILLSGKVWLAKALVPT